MVRWAVEAAAPWSPGHQPPAAASWGWGRSHTRCCLWQITAQGAWSNRVWRKKAKYRPSLQSTLDEGPVSEPFFLQPRGREPTGATFPCLTLVCVSMTNHHNGVAENNRNVFLLAWRPPVCQRLWGGSFLPPSLRGPRAPLAHGRIPLCLGGLGTSSLGLEDGHLCKHPIPKQGPVHRSRG